MDNPNIANCFLVHWKGYFVVILPAFYGLLVLAFGDHVANRFVYINIMFLIAFLCEVIPIGLNAMLPIGFFPLQNILKSEEVCCQYFHPVVAEFIFGMLIMTAMETTKYNHREAIIFIEIFGANPRVLHIVIVMLTTVLSIVLPNGFAAALMFMLTRAILANLESLGIISIYTEETKNDPDPTEKKPTKVVLGFYFSIAYTAEVAGACLLSGTTSNAMMRDMYDKQFPNSEETVSFKKMALYNTPPAMLIIFLLVIFIQVIYFGTFRSGSPENQAVNVSNEALAAAKDVNKETLIGLGYMTLGQMFSSLVIIIAFLLMYTRDPEFSDGWREGINLEVLNPTPIAFCAILMFMLPSALNFLACWDAESATAKTPGIVTWKVANTLVQWELIFVIGFSSALYLAMNNIKFTKSIGEILVNFKMDNSKATILAVVLFVEAFTQYVCNFATISVTGGGLMELALKSKEHPLYFLLPACLASSMSFLMPTCSMPLSLVKKFVNIHTFEMVLRGLIPLVIATIVVYVWAITAGLGVYDLKGSPSWLTPENMNIKYSDE